MLSYFYVFSASKKKTRSHLLLCWLPKAKQQAVVHKALKFLAVAIITDAYYRNFWDFDAGNKISNSPSISSRHTINLIHDENSLHILRAGTFVKNNEYITKLLSRASNYQVQITIRCK